MMVFASDKPLENPEEDELGYKDFARNIAEAICKLEGDDCIVISINGEWGSGKTTVLNFVEWYIRKDKELISKYNSNENIIIFKFNPWLFSGSGDLLYKFFMEFSTAILGKDIKESERSKKLSKISDCLKKLGTIFSVAGNLANLFCLIPFPINLVGDAITKISETIKPEIEQKSIYEIKKEIEDELESMKDIRILVIIDDIDRLMPDEIISLFKVIRAIADFPRTVYLLAFDEGEVFKALRNNYNPKFGQKYIEKIIQVQLKLPKIDKQSLKILLCKSLETILSSKSKEIIEDEKDRWNYICDLGILYLLRNIRDVKRFTNALRLTYPLVKDEVNPVDFIAIEFLRIFHPKIYDSIRFNDDLFVEGVVLSLRINTDPEKERLKRFYESLFEEYDEQEKRALKIIVSQLFPTVGSILGEHSGYGGYRRIYDKNYFSSYFRFSVENVLSRTEVERILSLTKDRDNFADELLRLAEKKFPNGLSYLSSFLGEVIAFINEESKIPDENVPNIIYSLIRVGDKIIAKDEATIGQINIIIGELLKRLNTQEERFNLLKEAFENCESIYLMSGIVSLLDHERMQYQEGYGLLTNEQITKLGKIVVSIIKEHRDKLLEYLDDPKIYDPAKVADILRVWHKFGDKNEFDDWVERNILSNDSRLIRLVLTGKLTTLNEIFNSDKLRQRCEDILKKDMSKPERDAIERLKRNLSENR